MGEPTQCPICESRFGAICTWDPFNGSGRWFHCTACGDFILSGSLIATLPHKNPKLFTDSKRSALSHFLRTSWMATGKPAFLQDDWFDKHIQTQKTLNPPDIAKNIIRFLGDTEDETGTSLASLPLGYYAIFGASSPRQANRVLLEMFDRKLIKVKDERRARESHDFKGCELSFEGWERYYREKSGQYSGSYGFLALKFGEQDAQHETLFREHLKPKVKQQLGYDIRDIRDDSRTGIIDNLLRERIRDAAFVLVDLSHDNHGAYWEAGYAEGLGKPVLYLCEQAKFDKEKTHFDTNHQTTIPWDASKPDKLVTDVVATLRRSMNLFPLK